MKIFNLFKKKEVLFKYDFQMMLLVANIIIAQGFVTPHDKLIKLCNLWDMLVEDEKYKIHDITKKIEDASTPSKEDHTLILVKIKQEITYHSLWLDIFILHDAIQHQYEKFMQLMHGCDTDGINLIHEILRPNTHRHQLLQKYDWCTDMHIDLICSKINKIYGIEVKL